VSVTEHHADVTVSVTEYSPKNISVFDRTHYGKSNSVYDRDTATISVSEHNIYIMKISASKHSLM